MRQHWAWLSIAILTLSSAVLSGCHSRNSRTIAFVPETTAAELWEAAHAGAEKAGRETGYHIYWNAPTREDDVQRQIALVERVIQDGSGGLILSPDQYLALMTPVREALAKHVPTVVIRSPLPISPTEGISYVLNNEDETGRIAAMRVGKLLKGKGTVAILGVDPNVSGIVLRSRTFEAALASNFPEISIVEKRMGSVNAAETQQVAEEVLQENPKLAAILGLNAVATRGALAALKAIRKDAKVKLVGCDQELDLMAGVRRGDIDSMIVENTYEMGYSAVRLIASHAAGKPGPGEIKLSPVLVDQSNIDDPGIQRMLSVNWRVDP